MILKISLIVIYLCLAIIFHFAIRKRLRFLSEKHMTHTGVPYFQKNHIFISGIVFILLLTLVAISIILILTLL